MARHRAGRQAQGRQAGSVRATTRNTELRTTTQAERRGELLERLAARIEAAADLAEALSIQDATYLGEYPSGADIRLLGEMSERLRGEATTVRADYMGDEDAQAEQRRVDAEEGN